MEGEQEMSSYETYGAAQKDFSAFAGYYVVLKYGYKTQSEHFGSRRHGQYYCHTGYSTDEDANFKQYELFQVGKRGGLKRLHLVAKSLPEGTPFVHTMEPDKATCCYHEHKDGRYQYYIREEVLDALIESAPETKWRKGPGPVTNYHW